MRVVRGLERARGCFSGPVVTIGNFDGVHLGHQVILSRVREDADHRGVDAVVLTFDPHPVAVLRPQAAPQLLMTLGDRLAALARCGVDATVVQRFTPEFAKIEAEEFVERFLVGVLGAQKLVVGHDLNFGYGRRGNAESLVEAGGRYGFAVEVIRPVVVEGIAVHSSVVRRTVAAGNVALAARLLGRPHIVRGRVVRGTGRGRHLGFATANLRPKTPLIPGEGVYAVRAVVGGRMVDGVTSIGRTPTFGGTETVVETHLFGETADLYGKMMAIRFVDRLRDQRKFESPEQLAAQIARDVERARAILAASSL
ncbi:MAG: bifunctional riboflavin kinase/FAD synthetase [Candidatus Dadabacteria bacterium]|nr:MAG: bifunctional riboflavin kinase/FAD synthetase [Candidatus Dadabacteria bacterium]